MQRWVAAVNVRTNGAIGVFWVKDFVVSAPSVEEARERALELALQAGYETRGINKVTPITEKQE